MYGTAGLVWATPDGDKRIAELARVSSPVNQGNHETAPRLISFLIRNRHWSPFEMASACIEIKTTRDIGRQILRHRSFSFQEFSQRYAEVEEGEDVYREMRLKGTSNRQGSLAESDRQAEEMVHGFRRHAFGLYRTLIDMGIAPECARAVLPEGLTSTRLYMTGTVRSWIHYISERMQDNVQREHSFLAKQIYVILLHEFPSVFEAVAISQQAV